MEENYLYGGELIISRIYVYYISRFGHLSGQRSFMESGEKIFVDGMVDGMIGIPVCKTKDTSFFMDDSARQRHWSGESHCGAYV